MRIRDLRATPLFPRRHDGRRQQLARPLTPAADGGGGLAVEPDSLLVSTVKRAWDGRGLVVRVVEYDGRDCQGRLRLGFAPAAAWLCDPVERPQERLPLAGKLVTFPVRGHRIITLLIEE